MSEEFDEMVKRREFEVFKVTERAALRALVKKEGKRNGQCWCDSGKKYKRCHWEEDVNERRSNRTLQTSAQ